MPGISGYRFIDYQKKLQIWSARYRLAAHDVNQEGLAMASRLHGGPWELAMKMKVPKTVREGGPRRDGVGGSPPTLAAGASGDAVVKEGWWRPGV